MHSQYRHAAKSLNCSGSPSRLVVHRRKQKSTSIPVEIINDDPARHHVLLAVQVHRAVYLQNAITVHLARAQAVEARRNGLGLAAYGKKLRTKPRSPQQACKTIKGMASTGKRPLALFGSAENTKFSSAASSPSCGEIILHSKHYMRDHARV